MDCSRPAVLLIGEADHHELREALDWLRQSTHLTVAGTVDQALQDSSCQERNWHTVIFAQPRPGMFTPRDVDRLSRALPLAHFVALLGSLCEGETRSGQPWPGVVRVYWHQWPTRCATELRMGIEPTSWQLPRTSSEIERTQWILQRPMRRGSGLVAVFTRSAVWFDALASACRVAGYASVWCTSDQPRIFQGAALALWDGATLDLANLEQLQRITRLLPQVPVIALLGFPRLDQQRQVRALGAVSVVSCPFLLPDLWTAMDAATASRPTQP